MIKYKSLILTVMPSLIFITIFILDLLFAGYGRKYDLIIYLGFIILFILMSASNQYDYSNGNAGNYFKTSFLFMSFVYGIWLSFELAMNGLNGIVGLILVILSYNASIFPSVYNKEFYSSLSIELGTLINVAFMILSFFMAIFGIFNVYVGSWNWRYFFG